MKRERKSCVREERESTGRGGERSAWINTTKREKKQHTELPFQERAAKRKQNASKTQAGEGRWKVIETKIETKKKQKKEERTRYYAQLVLVIIIHGGQR